MAIMGGAQMGMQTCYWALESDPRCKVAKILAELCPRVSWKVELGSNKLGCLAEEISKQSVQGGASFLLTVYIVVKCERREELKKELFSRKEPELEVLETPQTLHTATHECTAFLKKIYFMEVQLIYNVVLISTVHQSDLVIHIFFFIFFSLWFITGY